MLGGVATNVYKSESTVQRNSRPVLMKRHKSRKHGPHLKHGLSGLTLLAGVVTDVV